MANNSLQRFDNDGIELVIDTVTGEAFYPGYRALARVCSIGLTKKVHPETVKRLVESIVKGVTDLKVEETELLTPGGLQGVTIIPRQLGTKVIKKLNVDLYEEMAEVGHLVFLHQLAGYKVTSTAVEQTSKILKPETDAAIAKIQFAQQQYEFWKSQNNIRMMARFETIIAQTSDAYLLEDNKQLLVAGQPVANTQHKQYEGVVDVVIRLGLPWNSRFESVLGRHVSKGHGDLRIAFEDLPEEFVKDYRLSARSNKEVPSYMYPAYNEVIEDCVTRFCQQKDSKGWKTKKELKARFN